MSTESAIQFLSEIQKNESLRKGVEALEGSNLLAQLVVLAQRKGYDFTEEEYRNAVILESQGELSEEALGHVLEELGLDDHRQSKQAE